MIEARNVSYHYATAVALHEISFRVEPGGFWGIIGPNGSGKSTLLKVLSKVIAPQAGSIEIAGSPLTKIKLHELARKMAVVGSEAEFAFPYRVWEVAQMGRLPFVGRMQSFTQRDRARTEDALRRTEAWEFRDRYLHEISSGERQRVLLARALAQEPGILLLDEPTAHLDLHYEIEIFKILKDLNATDHMTVLAVSHNINLMAEFCQTLVVLNNGACRTMGSPREVLVPSILREVFRIECEIHANPFSNAPTILLNTKS